ASTDYGDRIAHHLRSQHLELPHALGKYAPIHGGHIIFWNLGLVVCFPPGATILFPAGLIRYSFVKVRPGEHRHAVLQWAGGGISRWLANGRRSDLDLPCTLLGKNTTHGRNTAVRRMPLLSSRIPLRESFQRKAGFCRSLERILSS
ncbi:hypothetical protein B0H13DRAFT_1666908, partial [Mycena leptocephala]